MSKAPAEKTTLRARPEPAETDGQQRRRPAHLRSNDPAGASDVAATAAPPEHVAVANMARALEEAVAAVGRAEAGQEPQLQPLLEKIEARLDGLIAALRADGYRMTSTNGQGPPGLVDGIGP